MHRWTFILVLGFAGPPSVRAQRDDEPPKLNQPVDFSQLVGVFQIAAKVEPTTVLVEEPMMLTVTITGQAQAPYLPKRDRLQLFPSEIQRDFYIEPGAERQEDGAWEFDYRLRAKHPTVQLVPGLKLVSYNPRQRRYQTAYSEAIPVTVRPLPEGIVKGNGLNVVRAPASFLELAQHDPPPRSPVLHLSPYQEVVLLALPPLVCILGAMWWRRRRRADIQRHRRRSRAVAQTAATLAATPADAETRARLVADYLRLRLDLPAQELTPAELESWLRRRGVSRDLRGRWRRFLEACDSARFAPAGAAAPIVAGDMAMPLIQALEEEPCLAGR